MPQSPHTELGDLIRRSLRCPFCRPSLEAVMPLPSGTSKPLRIVAFRQKSIRLECRQCGLRFSIDPANLADVIVGREAPPQEVIERWARRDVATPGQYLETLAQVKKAVARATEEERNRILALHRQGVAAAAPRKGQIRFPPRKGAS
jgi:hypothetical protein